MLVFYGTDNIIHQDLFVGCISAIGNDIEIELKPFGRCVFFTYDKNGDYIQIVGTSYKIEDIRGDE